MQVRLGRENIRELPAHLTLQKAQHTPNLLQGKAFAPEFRNNRNLDYFFRQINTFVALMARRNYLAFVPPLKLTQADLSDLRNISAVVCPMSWQKIRTDLPCFEHIARVPFPLNGTPNCTRPCALVKDGNYR